MVFSVSEANNFIKALLDAVPQLQTIFVRGEISNYKLYPSGHHYFTLKDEGSALRCVMFRGMASKLRFRPENGMKVIAFGRIGVFPRDGAYQLYCSDLSAQGVGDLYVAFEQLKEKLSKEGLFDPAHKKPLPAYPKCIGVVTSKTGAALQDIRNVISRRWPSVRVLLCPVTVQGFEAARQIAAAIRTLDQSGRVDEIIVARGGGSREDLWVFNAEEIARAAFRCKTPLISAIGHEIDYTLLDFVADQRAPTPSAAAELAVPDREEQRRIFENIEENIHKNIQKRLALCYNGLEQYNFLLEQNAPGKILQQYSSRLQQMQQAIQMQQKARMNGKNMQLQHAAALVASLDPYRVLARGYALVTDTKGKVCTVEQLQPEQTICVRSRQYQARCRVETVEEINESTQKL